MDKSELFKLAASDDDKLLISKTVDAYNGAKSCGYARSTCFLNGSEQALAKKVLDKLCAVYRFYGGYNDAERKIAVCFDDEAFTDSYLPPISLIDAACRYGNTLSHRDYLGALMSLGIKREQFGDIITDGCGAKIFCIESIAEYVKNQLTAVGSYGVKVQIADCNDIIIPERKFKELSFTVAALRTDAVVAKAAGVSRSEALELLSRGHVTVNWNEVSGGAKAVALNDVISIKGCGRFLVSEIGGTTKKGRIFIKLKKYI